MYDFLIVGAGLYGSVFAHQATLHGKKCLVIDRRNRVAGNIACDTVDGITVHLHGPHLFHTKDYDIWKYVTGLTPFFNYYHQVSANYKGKIYSLPFNMNTFHQVWPDVTTPEQAMARIKEQSAAITWKPTNLEDHVIKLIGTDLYHILIKGYSEKQWGRPCSELPPSTIARLPFRLTYDNNYFSDQYQGIPVGGYNKLIEAMLSGVEVRLNTDYLQNREYFDGLAKRIVFTGPIDEYFDYKFGELEYRSLRFETKVLEVENFQGAAGMKFTEKEIPYTRIVEYKHFERKICPHTVLTYEYPADWKRGLEPYYSINDEANMKRYRQYRDLAEFSTVIFGGRLAEYRYYDMHQVIGSALKRCKDLFD